MSNGEQLASELLLGVVFVTLKLIGYIDWSWWLVTLPFWGGFALLAIFVIIIAIRMPSRAKNRVNR